MYPRILDPQPSITELITNRVYWNPKILHLRGKKLVYDQDIRKGKCYCCTKLDKAQWKQKTYLHHLFYDDIDPLAYTIEVCGKCHYKIDPNNKRLLDRLYDRRVSKPQRRYW